MIINGIIQHLWTICEWQPLFTMKIWWKSLCENDNIRQVKQGSETNLGSAPAQLCSNLNMLSSFMWGGGFLPPYFPIPKARFHGVRDLEPPYIWTTLHCNRSYNLIHATQYRRLEEPGEHWNWSSDIWFELEEHVRQQCLYLLPRYQRLGPDTTRET